MKLSVTVDARATTRLFKDWQLRQLPFAMASALNSVGFQSQKTERTRFSSVFDHPRPFTQRSVLVTKASKANPAVTIFVRPEVSAYLAPYEFGGVHVIPGSKQLVPVDLGAGVRLDQYGQLSQAARKRLNALAVPGASNVFFGTVHGIRGYWLRPKPSLKARRAKPGQRKSLLPLVLIAEVKPPIAVTKHLGFGANVAREAQAAFPAAFNAALARALASAR